MAKILDLRAGAVVRVGKFLEDNAVILSIDISDLQEVYPDGAPLVVYQRADGLIYNLANSVDGDVVLVPLSSVETAIIGVGQIEIRWIGDDFLLKSPTYKIKVVAGIAEATVVPDPLGQTYLDQIAGHVSEMAGHRAAVEDVLEDVVGLAEEVSSGKVATEGFMNRAEAAAESAEDDAGLAESARLSVEGAALSLAEAISDAEESEDGRVSAEGLRVTAETGRVTAEGLRASAESSRASAEGGRVSVENARVGAESIRASAEISRSGAESLRATAETGRVNAETARVTAEGLRATAETGRNAAEGTRVSNESARVSAESTRQSQESARQSNTAAAISDCEDAAEAANDAAALVDGRVTALEEEIELKADRAMTYTKTEIDSAIAPVTSQLAENADNAALWRAKDGNPATCHPVPKSRLYPRIELVATQSGTGDPSPENIRPIVPSMRAGDVLSTGRTGKNRWVNPMPQTRNGVTLTVDSDGWIILNGTATGNYVFSLDFPTAIKGGQYTISANNPVVNAGVYIRFNPVGTNDLYLTSENRTNVYDFSDDRLTFCGIRVGSGAVLSDFKLRPQLELGSTATPYEPYSGESYDLLTAAQDYYGLPDAPVVVDAEAGTVTVQARLDVFNGAENWQLLAENSNAQSNLYYLGVPAYRKGSGVDVLTACTHAPVHERASDGTYAKNSFALNAGSGNVVYLRLRLDTGITTVAQLKAALTANPMKALIPLATPITIPFTPPVIAALDRLSRTASRQNVLTVTANDSTVGVQKQTVTYQKSPIRESDEIAAAIAALA